MSRHSLIPAAALALGLFAAPASAADAGSDVQRLLQQRDQQETELRLRMQQQQDRAVRPPPDAGSDFRRQQLERDQQQRQQQSLDLESRGAASRALGASTGTDRASRDSEAAREAAEQEQRFRDERRTEAERSIEAGRRAGEPAPAR
jgi:hypothetical protein